MTKVLGVIAIVLTLLLHTDTVIGQHVLCLAVVFCMVEHLHIVVLSRVFILNGALLLAVLVQSLGVLFLVQTRSLTVEEVARAHISLVHLNLLLILANIHVF